MVLQKVSCSGFISFLPLGTIYLALLSTVLPVNWKLDPRLGGFKLKIFGYTVLELHRTSHQETRALWLSHSNRGSRWPWIRVVAV